MALTCVVVTFKNFNFSPTLQNRKPSLALIFLLCYKEPLYIPFPIQPLDYLLGFEQDFEWKDFLRRSSLDLMENKNVRDGINLESEC